MKVTADDIYKIMPNAPVGDPEKELPYLLRVIDEYEINTKLRLAAFLANVAAESGELYYVEEIADGWEYEWRGDLGNTQKGDGPKYKGHGYIQITGRLNHTTVGEGLGVDSVNNPTILCKMPYAWLSAAYYWRYMSSWGDLNQYADVQDFGSTVLGVRGGPDDNRWKYWNAALEVLQDEQEEEYPTLFIHYTQDGWAYSSEYQAWIKSAPNVKSVSDSDGWQKKV